MLVCVLKLCRLPLSKGGRRRTGEWQRATVSLHKTQPQAAFLVPQRVPPAAANHVHPLPPAAGVPAHDTGTQIGGRGGKERGGGGARGTALGVGVGGSVFSPPLSCRGRGRSHPPATAWSCCPAAHAPASEAESGDAGARACVRAVRFAGRKAPCRPRSGGRLATPPAARLPPQFLHPGAAHTENALPGRGGKGRRHPPRAQQRVRKTIAAALPRPVPLSPSPHLHPPPALPRLHPPRPHEEGHPPRLPRRVQSVLQR